MLVLSHPDKITKFQTGMLKLVLVKMYKPLGSVELMLWRGLTRLLCHSLKPDSLMAVFNCKSKPSPWKGTEESSDLGPSANISYIITIVNNGEAGVPRQGLA